jgi:hypothetical protein
MIEAAPREQQGMALALLGVSLLLLAEDLLAAQLVESAASGTVQLQG